jgi:tetratricopeptide (TPR) repeat protein
MKSVISVLGLLAALAAPASAQTPTARSAPVIQPGKDDLVWCKNQQASLEQRTRYCEAAVKDGRPDVLLRLARLQQIAGGYDAALASIARLSERLPDVPTGYAAANSRRWLPILTVRGEVYAQMGKFEEARKDADEYERISTDGAAGDNLQCWVRAVAGRELEQGLEHCDKAVARKPRFATFLDSRGMIYLKLGRFQDAVNDYDKALAQNPDMISSRYGRGIAKLRLGDAAGGKADMDDATRRDVTAAQAMAGYGLTP